MKHEEAAQIVQLLGAAWRVEVPALTVAVWCDHLRAVNVDVGREAARITIDHGGQFMPSPGDFLKVCRTTAQRLGIGQRALPLEGQSYRPSREEALERVAALREVVASAETRLPSRRSPTPPSDRPERSVPLTACALDDHRFCGSESAVRPKEGPPDAAPPTQP